MTIYWPEAQTAQDPGNENTQNTEYENTGLVLELPEEVLQRHGARMLRPTTAVSVVGLDPPARSTAYVASVLLMPPNLVNTDGKRGELNGFLADVGMQIPEESVDLERLEEIQPVLLQALDGPRPVDVDAWTALLAIRKNNPVIGNQIGLDHLMIASGDLSGVPGAIQGVAPPFGFGGPVATGYLDGPVALEMPPIHRQAPAALALRRRAVVAVLDTGIGENDRLDIKQLDVKQPLATWPTGLHVTVDTEIQEAVRVAGQKLVTEGLRVEVIGHPKDQPLTRNPLIGTQDWCFGHGTFIAGIIQQIAPDATVLAVRVMGSDGIARESVVVAALQALVKRVDRALASSDMREMVDVVSLSLGYPYEGTVEQEKESPVAKQIVELRRRGVLVVAAAGNSASAERFFPACMSTHTDAPKPGEVPVPVGPPVINVGALNPNGSKALYTNEGPAVTCYATGTNVVSTFPQDANASRQPLVQVRADNRPDLPQYRQSPDVDDHTRSPFAIWTGSSFAAPHVAAHLANALHNVAPLVGTVSAQEAALNRAASAVDAVKTAAAKT